MQVAWRRYSAVKEYRHAMDQLSRRRMLAASGAAALGLAAGRALAQGAIDLGLPGGFGERPMTSAFPQKGPMILQRMRPPLLETPFEVFDDGVFTPNDRFYVRWHQAVIPTEVDVDKFRLTVRGHVNNPLSLSLKAIEAMPRAEIAAVNQCSGNSRGFFTPRVEGAQWGNGAMGNALWSGVPLRVLLDRAGVRPGAVAVRIKGMDAPLVDDAPLFMKSLSLDHARDGEVMLAFGMNGSALPLLNGAPLRLVVPGWYSTYWVKMVDDIEVLGHPDDNYWTTTAYRIPDTPGASVRPGQTGFGLVPINRMVPRSFVTNLRDGTTVKGGSDVGLRGIAFGGDRGVARVEVSTDGGREWSAAALGPDEGKYGFRRWQAPWRPVVPGPQAIKVRCTNDGDVVQPDAATWNGSGFMRNVVETVTVTVG